jgi:hypothetical protein
LVALTVGCASGSRATLISLQATRIAFLEPSYDLDLEIKVSAWAAGASAAAVRRDHAEVNFYLRRWYEVVVPSFSEAFVSEVQGHGVGVDRLPIGATSTAFPLVRSFLGAGFVYRTYISSSYAPFVSVVLQLSDPKGSFGYRQLYVATDRSFNPLMTTLPAATPFLLADIASLAHNPASALDAFRSLAQQLAKKFASDLLLERRVSNL